MTRNASFVENIVIQSELLSLHLSSLSTSSSSSTTSSSSSSATSTCTTSCDFATTYSPNIPILPVHFQVEQDLQVDGKHKLANITVGELRATEKTFHHVRSWRNETNIHVLKMGRGKGKIAEDVREKEAPHSVDFVWSTHSSIS